VATTLYRRYAYPVPYAYYPLVYNYYPPRHPPITRRSIRRTPIIGLMPTGLISSLLGRVLISPRSTEINNDAVRGCHSRERGSVCEGQACGSSGTPTSPAR